MAHETKLVKLPDSRHLAYAEYGDPEGVPAIYLHGFPGSRLEARLFDLPARQHGLRVIAPDRNGLGLSDPKAGRRLIEWAVDVEALADNLKLERFFLIGISGGGPYALAYAHKCAERLEGLTLVCPLGPLDQPALLEAMRWPAKINFRSIRDTPWLSNISFRFSVVPLTQLWPQWIYQIMLGMAPPPDVAVLNRPTVRKAITASIREAVRQGADGVLQEMSLYTQPWGFDPAEITIPIQLWHGTADKTVPILHGLTLAERLPECEMHIVDGEGHFSLPIDSMEKIQRQLIGSRFKV
ncbi:MAG: alpha/beta hydrolase [Candidatus Thiodiazotropha taylori]|nr:alpha/beta hydrolase [Candidatus Thiodiazotropha taylori]MCW4222941.1 alpha/beta hydrolase [Candidatus Thiodiazotropha endolucinida]MCG7884521.1 alpha/beta hydrolase [Candidatus Thiodiazotropha taylori]MCG8030657.1 alpha/beta hydrolase [Candidatus Thiodiazotropha taylori]MCG8074773.1 alpha/beta hydrolase [Candidatus Thiodiazotropha taylori]